MFISRPTTSLKGTVLEVTDKRVHLQLEGQTKAALQRDDLWMPRKMVEGGNSIKAGSTDPLVSDWWLRQCGFLSLILNNQKQEQSS